MSQAHAADWTGIYVGAFAGAGNSSSNWDGQDDAVSSETIAISSALSGSGGYYGGYIGFNYQMDNLVAGLEADYGAFGTVASKTLDGSEGLDLASSTDTLGSVRARLGVVASDDLLIYATGGYAFQSGSQVWDDQGVYNMDPVKVDMSGGWVAGAGVEYALSTDVLLRAEGLYYQFAADGVATGEYETDSFHVKQSIAVGRVGISYKF